MYRIYRDSDAFIMLSLLFIRHRKVTSHSWRDKKKLRTMYGILCNNDEFILSYGLLICSIWFK